MVNSVTQQGGGGGIVVFNGTDLPSELPEAVMNGLADGLMTDKEKKTTSAGNSLKTTRCHMTTTSAKRHLSR